MMKLSVVLATKNEEKNIGLCLESVRQLADEIVVVDEYSTDKTREIAKGFGARVFKVKHEAIFHKTKQKAIDKATGEWILQLDADERVTKDLAEEIKEVVSGRRKSVAVPELFERHQKLVEKRDGVVGKKTGEMVAYFVPRLNFFLGKPLRHAGVYPDGVIRLIKKGKAYFPSKSVHEQIKVDGRVGWLLYDLEHHDSPTLRRYLERANRYTTLTAREFSDKQISKSVFSIFYFSFIKPLVVFLKLYFRHKGFLDGIRGFLWSAFSALHFPIAYWKYWIHENYVTKMLL